MRRHYGQVLRVYAEVREGRSFFKPFQNRLPYTETCCAISTRMATDPEGLGRTGDSVVQNLALSGSLDPEP